MLNIYLETAIIHLRNVCGFRSDVGWLVVMQLRNERNDALICSLPEGWSHSLILFGGLILFQSSIMTKAKFSAGV